MKFTLIALLGLATLISGAEMGHVAKREEASQLDAASQLAADAGQACGAEGSCHGFGGGDLCNDRCKKCYGPSGYYSKGECCGTGWQACCCYYG